MSVKINYPRVSLANRNWYQPSGEAGAVFSTLRSRAKQKVREVAARADLYQYKVWGGGEDERRAYLRKVLDSFLIRRGMVVSGDDSNLVTRAVELLHDNPADDEYIAWVFDREEDDDDIG